MAATSGPSKKWLNLSPLPTGAEGIVIAVIDGAGGPDLITLAKVARESLAHRGEGRRRLAV